MAKRPQPRVQPLKGRAYEKAIADALEDFGNTVLGDRPSQRRVDEFLAKYADRFGEAFAEDLRRTALGLVTLPG